MNVTATEAAIRTRFRDQIATPQGVTTVYDNDDARELAPPYIVLTIQHGTSDPIEFGNGITYRSVGVATAQILTSIEKGPGAATALADLIIAAFRMIESGGVKYRVPSVGASSKGGTKYLLPVSIPFWVDDHP